MVGDSKVGKFAEARGNGLTAFPEDDVITVSLLVGLNRDEGVVREGAGEDAWLHAPVVLVRKEGGWGGRRRT